MSIWNRHLCSFFKREGTESLPRGTYRCPLCSENVNAGEIRSHAALDDQRFREGLVIARIKQDHPEWVEADGACEQCLEYYRQTVGFARGKVPVRPRPRES